ncbi:MAG TPA: hypothetical protein IAB01_07495 [Candidatus Avidesulfovibrio excrementigallinarum]|nr:hypothetical protein [Candidatus Avidesulfovibrio excrementigallinarum]
MVMTTTRLAFGPWEPDAALLDGRQAPEARNVVPGRRGYRPLHGLSPQVYPALDSQVRAGFSLKGTDGSLLTLAATDSAIYALENGVWTSRYSGSAASPTRAFAEYGPAVYALFGTQLLKSAVTTGNAEPFAPVEGAPAAEVLGVIRDFVVLGRLSQSLNGIRWSGLDRPDEWPEPGSNDAQYIQSDMQIFPSGGRVQAIVGGVGGVDGLIFLERAIQRATYVGSPYIFQFDVVDRAGGCLAPASPVVCGNVCLYLAEDGWRMTDGASVKSIGVERVDDWFFQHCATDRTGEVRGVHDPENRIALWTFPSDAAPAGVCDRILLYNYAADRWSWGEIATETVFPDYTRGLTLEELDAFGPLDSLPFASLDVAALQNGRQTLSAFNAGHQLAGFNGDTLEAVIDTAEQGGSRMMVHGLRPLVDSGAAQALPVFRNRQMDARRFGVCTKQQRDGVCCQHLSTVYLAARVNIPAGEPWSHAVGVEALTEPEGGL